MNAGKIMMALIVSAMTLGLTVAPAAAATSDNFDASHDYLVSGVGGTAWDGVLNGGNAAAIDADTTNAGQLTITTNTSNTTGWDGNLQTGPYLYQDVTGDFVATVVVSSGTAANYNVASLLARDPSAASVADENFFSANYNFFGTAGVQRRNVNKGSTTKFDSTTVAAATPVALRITRIGDDFTAAYSTDGGANWTDMAAATTKSDMPETIQIGLTAGNFGTNSYTAVFDNFTVGPVPEPASIGLILAGGALMLSRRR